MVIESVDAKYVNNSVYTPLSGRRHIKLPREFKNPLKILINIKNNDNKCSLWCHIKSWHLNPLKRHHERISKIVKKWLMILIK